MPRLCLFPVRNARIIVSTFKSDWLAMRVPRQLARSPSSCSASQKLSQPFSVWRRLLSMSSRCRRLALPSRKGSLLLSEGCVMAFFLHIVSDSAHFFSFRSTSLSFSGILGLPSRNLSCSHTIWLCFLVSQPRCAIRGLFSILSLTTKSCVQTHPYLHTADRERLPYAPNGEEGLQLT